MVENKVAICESEGSRLLLTGLNAKPRRGSRKWKGVYPAKPYDLYCYVEFDRAITGFAITVTESTGSCSRKIAAGFAPAL